MCPSRWSRLLTLSVFYNKFRMNIDTFSRIAFFVQEASDLCRLACVCAQARDAVSLEFDARFQRVAPNANPDQRRVMEALVRRAKSAYLMGLAGSGKTYTLRASMSCLGPKERSRTGICAPTGAAATVATIKEPVEMHAYTINIMFNIVSHQRNRNDPPFVIAQDDATDEEREERVEDSSYNPQVQTFPTCRLDPSTFARLENMQRLVVDEVSMVQVDTFELMDLTLRFVKGTPHTPFGGVQLIIMGDFAQLPPVKPRWRPDGFRFAFQHPSFGYLNPMRLTQVMRTQDAMFAQIQRRCQRGEATNADCQYLRQHSRPPNSPASNRAVMSSNPKCKTINTNRLQQLQTQQYFINTPDTIGKYVLVGKEAMSASNAAVLLGIPEIAFDFPDCEDLQVPIKEGARIRCDRNIYEHNNNGGNANDLPRFVLVNGHVGTVTSVTTNVFGNVSVNAEWDHDPDSEMEIPTVRKVKLQSFTHTNAKGDVIPVRCVIQYIPISLAWASTLHKAQGASISEEVDVDLKGVTKDASGAWVTQYGFAYTALSRMTSLGLAKFTPGVWPALFQCDPIVKAFLDRMESV